MVPGAFLVERSNFLTPPSGFFFRQETRSPPLAICLRLTWSISVWAETPAVLPGGSGASIWDLEPVNRNGRMERARHFAEALVAVPVGNHHQ